MRPAKFDYVRASSVEEAVRALEAAGPDARVLAGGQTLANLMRARVVRPSTVVDISRLSSLEYIRAEADYLAVGALCRLRDVEASALLRDACPALAEAAAAIGDVQVRNRATAGGNLFNPEPSSDLAPVLLASGGSVVVEGPTGRQEIPAEEFFARPLGSPLRPAEVVVEVRFRRSGAASAFEKLSRRAADPAMASAAVFLRLDGGAVSEVGVALGAVHERPVRAAPVEERLAGAPLDEATAAVALQEFCAGLSPPTSPHADAAYRKQVAPIVALRALRRAWDRAGGR